MTLLRGFTTVFGSSVLFGVLGAAIGWGLGAFSPAYYEVIFHRPDDGSWDIARTGLGLGLVQGAGAGLAVGLVLVGIQAWYDVRMQQLAQE